MADSALKGACTAAITEIQGRRDGKDQLEAFVEFQSKEWLESELTHVLADLAQEEKPEATISILPPSESRTKLLAIYPHVANIPLNQLSVANLMQDEIVAKLLEIGSAKVEASTPKELQEKLSHFISSTSDRSQVDIAAWHLVKRVKIQGKIPALHSSNLVDLPGYGDVNNIRNAVAEEYLKTAQCVFLVADMKRAKDDRDMARFLEKILKQLLADGRSARGSLALILTGADLPSGDNEVPLTQDETKEVNRLQSEAFNISQEIIKKKAAAADPLTTKAEARELKADISDDNEDLATHNRAKHKLVARARSSFIVRELRRFYHEVHTKLSPDHPPDELDIFCVGSRDYLSIIGENQDEPAVFNDAADTGIPALAEYIQQLGETHALTDASEVLVQIRNLLSQINAYYEADRNQNKSSKHQMYEKFAAKSLRKLQKDCRTAVDDTLQKVSGDLESLLSDLAAAVSQAEAESIEMFRQLPSQYHWNTFSALMRRFGEWKETDLNEELTKDIFPAIMSKWASVMNRFIPIYIEELESSLCDNIDAAIESLCTRALRVSTLSDPVLKASRTIGYEYIMANARKSCSDGVMLAHREGNRSFKGIVKDVMKPHYAYVGTLKGKGMMERMKEENNKFMQENHGKIFSGINVRTEVTFENIENLIRTDLDLALESIFASINSSLVTIQSSRTVRKRRLKAMKPFMKKRGTELRKLERLVTARRRHRGE